jgi:hypothetical protein
MELFEAYPVCTNINGRTFSLRNITKNFKDLDDMCWQYGRMIKFDQRKHEEILELLEYAKENDLIHSGICDFILSQGWLALELYRDESEEEHFQMLRSEYYPDVWTEEIIAENQKDYDKLMTILESYGWSLDDISYYVSVATDNVYNSFIKMPTEYMERLIVAIQEDGE